MRKEHSKGAVKSADSSAGSYRLLTLLQNSVFWLPEHDAPCFLLRSSVPGRLTARLCLQNTSYVC